MPAFSLLRSHSAYSFLYGPRSIEDLVRRARELGYARLALTDINGLYGVHRFIEAARDAGLKPILGAELRSGTEPSAQPIPPADSTSAAPARAVGRGPVRGAPAARLSALALATSREGFANLCELLSEGRTTDTNEFAPSIARLSRGLVIASESPELLTALAGRVEHLYAGIGPRSVGAVAVARRLGLPLLALGDATFLEPEDIPVHRVLRSIATGSTIGGLEESRCAPADAFIIDPAEAQRLFASYPEALAANAEVAALCSLDSVFDGFIFPAYRSAAGQEPAFLLRARTFEGAELRYGELSDAVVERIEYELELICRRGFTDYFLAVADIVGLASRTCGRGSGAASIVSYCLGITNVDPIRHRLYFERFLNAARPDPPDIDVDFAWDERDELIDRVIERFGRENCARVANHNCFRPRSAFRETAKAYGVPEGEIAKIERAAFDLDERPEELDAELWREIGRIARRIEGLPRGLGMHCGGLVITPDPIRRHAPIGASAEGYPLLAWEKEGTEAAGLVKIDLLGNRSLAVIRDALADLAEQGTVIDPYSWNPIDDRETREMLARGDSMGVFYIESPAMRQLQKKTGKGDYAHIVIHSSIIRPAANKFISEYVERLKGKPWAPLHPRLARVFDETYGILCYQEDVSKTAVALAGFDEAEADALRKILAKKAGEAKLKVYEERFRAGCRERGVDEATIAAVWEMMLSFDGYSFCKPHSASYAMVSFQSAYLRFHHPAAFMAAVISNGGGYYTAQAYVSEARRMGLAVFGPDLNRSRLRYHSRGSTVIVGFMAISRLSRAAIDAILSERERGGDFADLEDLSRRLTLGREECIALVASGCLDGIAQGLSREQQARRLLGGRREERRGASEQRELFASAALADTHPAARRTARGADLSETAARRRSEAERRAEYENLGFLREGHPISLWSSRIRVERGLRGAELESHRGKCVSLIGWPVTQKEVLTKDALPMAFVSFEDETAIFETVLFPEQHKRFRPLLFEARPFWLRGVVEDDQGAFYLRVEDMERV
ncbi:MAG TPA: DNA polymerase III subunit alpha [Rectinemataceae bacterium]|nr:DNA polymerase III subunit alpha [Rectinemataceae bacterium]